MEGAKSLDLSDCDDADVFVVRPGFGKRKCLRLTVVGICAVRW
jgi:hypothetical protein